MGLLGLGVRESESDVAFPAPCPWLSGMGGDDTFLGGRPGIELTLAIPVDEAVGAGASISSPSIPLVLALRASTASSRTAGTVWSSADPWAKPNPSLDGL